MKLKKINILITLFCSFLSVFLIIVIIIINLDFNGIKIALMLESAPWLIWIEIAATLVLIAFISIIANYFFNKYISKPFYQLKNAMMNVSNDRIFYSLSSNAPEEFKDILNTCYSLLNNFDIKSAELEAKNEEFSSLAGNIPGGMMKCKPDGNFEFAFISSGFLKTLDCTKEDIDLLYNNQFFNTIIEEDREMAKLKLKSQLSSGNCFIIEYRVSRKDGSYIWIMNKGQLVKNEGHRPMLYCIVIDISQTKNIQQKMLKSNELNSLIMSQTEDVLFEYTLETDIINFSSNWIVKYGRKCEYNNFLEETFKSERIYLDEFSIVKEFFITLINGTLYSNCEFRIRKNNGEYVWCRVRATAVYNDADKLYKVVGVIADIDKEKKQSQVLLSMAQKDTLTGLYNKGATQIVINDYLQKEGKGHMHTFFIIDIDYFKRINDNFGHFFGDTLLSEMAQEFSSIFRTTDILGRIGGDEFVVLLKETSSLDLVISKAKHLIEVCSNSSFAHKHEMIKSSCSIGISIYPSDGTDFMTLYRKADSALYMAKNQGRAKYCFFKDERQ